MDKMLGALEYASQLVMTYMCTSLQAQLRGAQEVVSTLEPAAKETESLLGRIRMQAQVQQTHKQERAETISALRQEQNLLGKSLTFADVCKVLQVNPDPEAVVMPPMYKGEGVVMRVERVFLLDLAQPIPGILVLTNYRLFFALYADNPGVDEDPERAMRVPRGVAALAYATLCVFIVDRDSGAMLREVGGVRGLAHRLLCLPGGSMSQLIGTGVSVALMSISRLKPTVSDKIIELWTEDLQAFAFSFRHSPELKLSVISKSIESFAYSVSTAFAFYYKMDDVPSKWALDSVAEYARQGVDVVTKGKNKTGWRLTTTNKAYDLCPTYPAVLAVPALMSDFELFEAAKHRSKKRLPVLSWLHQGRVALLRSSQPLMTASGKHDREYLDMISCVGVGKGKRLKIGPLALHRACMYSTRGLG